MAGEAPARRGGRLALCLALLLPAPAAAAGLSLGGAGAAGLPVEISADSGIEWQQQAQVYIARGHAVAKRGDMAVDADTLIAHYRPTKGSGGTTEIYRVDADGHVVITRGAATVAGDQAVYDVDQQIGVVTGKHLKLTTAADVVTARDSLEWYDQKQIAVARGDAVAGRGDKRIRADVLTAYLEPAGAAAKPAKPAAAKADAPLGAAGGRIRRVDAQGNVLVSTATDIGRGDYGVYNAETGIVTLIGNVTITRGANTIRGQYAVMDLNNNVSRMMPAPGKPGARVEGLFVRQETPAAAGKPNPAAGKKP
jgi:lipopolysaccharide export system protein LptA